MYIFLFKVGVNALKRRPVITKRLEKIFRYGCEKESTKIPDGSPFEYKKNFHFEEGR